jgi:hypothetical protein
LPPGVSPSGHLSVSLFVALYATQCHLADFLLKLASSPQQAQSLYQRTGKDASR